MSIGFGWTDELQDFLHFYHATSHGVINYSASELGHLRLESTIWSTQDITVDLDQAWQNKKKLKRERKIYTDTKRTVKLSNIDVGDEVVVNNFAKKNNLSTTFSPQLRIVIQRNGTRL